MARLKGFERLTKVDKALSILFETLKWRKIGDVHISIEEAYGRVAAEDIVAPMNLPPFDHSAVDGYALRAQDTFETSQFKPRSIRLTENEVIDNCEAKQVWTGNRLPKGADAVIMLEHVMVSQDKIEVVAPVTPGQNVSAKGEDFSKGEVIVESGTRLQAHHIGALAALGITHLKAAVKPKVAIISTGSELVELGQKPQPQQIINSNRFVISDMCRELGADPINLGIARDDTREIGDMIAKGLEEANIVVTTGGTSVGAADLVPTVIDQMGKPGILVHGVAMRPAMPTALAVLREKPIFVLSGYPVAAMVGFEVFVRPTIQKMQGMEPRSRPMLKARLTRPVPGLLGRRVYLRVRVFQESGEFYVDPVRTKGSGLFSSMTKANGYVIIPEDREGFNEGEIVVVHLFNTTEGCGETCSGN